MSTTAIRTFINMHFVSAQPWQIVTITTTATLMSVWLYNVVINDGSFTNRAKQLFIKLIRNIPSVKAKIDAEVDKVLTLLGKDVAERRKDLEYITVLPQEGMTADKIHFKVEESLKIGDDWKNGYVSGSVYYHSEDLMQLVKEVYGKTFHMNNLHADVFPGLCKMESDVVRMAADLFHGDADTCGTMTTGGTESILLACKAYRDYARHARGVTKPEIVAPVTAHAAFDKAAKFLGLRVRKIQVDDNYQVSIKAMGRAINSNTIMLVGSAPNFPYGTADDIQSISELGLKHKIPVHVDACLGGFLTAFMMDAGYVVPPCDFQLGGVTSLSADTHKYGYAPKGTSIILYRNLEYLHHQYTVMRNWPGGIYFSPTVNGSRAGGSIAVCWATMLSFGREGYTQATRDIIHTSRYIESRLRSMNGIFIFGQPTTSVIAFGSTDFDIYRLADALSTNGWNLNVLQNPPGIHIAITHIHTQSSIADKFLLDVQNGLSEILKNPKQAVEGKLALYGSAQKIPDASIIDEVLYHLMDTLFYYTPTKKSTNYKQTHQHLIRSTF